MSNGPAKFESWYVREYLNASQETSRSTRSLAARKGRHLTARQRRQLPKALPITAGRVHFLRWVDEWGDIRLLNEPWHINQRLAHQYVWAVIVTHEQRLRIYSQRSAQDKLHSIKTFRYEIAEPVQPLHSEFRSPYRRRKMCTMSSDLGKLTKSKK